MSTRTHGGPSGISGLLDHETQVRPYAQKSCPHDGKRGGTGNLHDCNGAARNTRQATTVGLFAISVSRKTHPLLLRSFSGAFLSSDPYSRAATCHYAVSLLLAVLKKILAEQTRVDQTAPGVSRG